jgi:iron complex outermembrane receptor protein
MSRRRKPRNDKRISASQYKMALLASTALISAHLVQAQETSVSDPDASASNDESVIEEIVVRGVARQFRPQDQSSATGLVMDLIDTPQSVTVLTSEMMATIGASTIYEAADLIPGVTFGGLGFGNETIILRGIDNDRIRINGLQAGGNSATMDSHALERIEIVRGPATVLYGVTSSFGGEVNHVLKRPQADRFLDVGVEFGSYDSQTYKFDATGALSGSEKVRGRLAVKYADNGRWFDIQNLDVRTEKTTVFAAVDWDITPQTTATFSYYHFGRQGDPIDGSALVQLPDGSLALPQDAFPDRVDPDTFYVGHPDRSQAREDYTNDLYFGELTHTLDNEWRVDAKAMVSEVDNLIDEFFAFGPFGGYDLADDQAYLYSYDVRDHNKILTFNLSLGGDFELFNRDFSFFAAYEYDDNLDPQSRLVPTSHFIGFVDIDFFADGVYDGVQPLLSDGTPLLPIDRSLDALGIGRQEGVEATNHKGSVQVMAKLTDRFSVLAGVLVHDNKSTLTRFYDGGVPFEPPEETKSDYNEVLTRFSATYDLIDDGEIFDDATVYFTFSEGFAPQIEANPEGEIVFIPQTMDAFEIGLKAELLGGAVGTSIAYFQNNVQHILTGGAEVGNITGRQSGNGNKDSQGIEVELVGELLPGWNMAFNYTWYDGEIYDETIDPDTNTRVYPFSIVPKTSPEHLAALTTTYEFLDGALRGFRAGGTVKYSSDYGFNDGLHLIERFSPPGNPQQLVDGEHMRVDLNFSYMGFGEPLEDLGIYANIVNVFDEDIMVAREGHPGFSNMFIDRKFVKGGFTFKFD